MSTYWETNKIKPETLARLGPFLDGIVGTNGEYQDLYAAINTGGWKYIMLATGATLSQDLTISAAGGFIVAFYPTESLNLGAKKITITGNYWHLEGFKLSGAGAALEIQSNNITASRIAVVSATSHGLYLNTSGTDLSFSQCVFRSNGGDGVRIATTSSRNRFTNCRIDNNGGYGINALIGSGDAAAIAGACRLTGNTSGSHSTGVKVDTGNNWT